MVVASTIYRRKDIHCRNNHPFRGFDKIPNVSLYIYYCGNISSICYSNSEDFASQLREHFEETFISLFIRVRIDIGKISRT